MLGFLFFIIIFFSFFSISSEFFLIYYSNWVFGDTSNNIINASNFLKIVSYQLITIVLYYSFKFNEISFKKVISYSVYLFVLYTVVTILGHEEIRITWDFIHFLSFLLPILWLLARVPNYLKIIYSVILIALIHFSVDVINLPKFLNFFLFAGPESGIFLNFSQVLLFGILAVFLEIIYKNLKFSLITIILSIVGFYYYANYYNNLYFNFITPHFYHFITTGGIFILTYKTIVYKIKHNILYIVGLSSLFWLGSYALSYWLNLTHSFNFFAILMFSLFFSLIALFVYKKGPVYE